jgi:hypothetical protein
MLFKLATAIIAATSNLPAAHGSGFIRRATADNSNVTAAAEPKFGKAVKEDFHEEEPSVLIDNSMEAEAFPSESIEAETSSAKVPEPRFFSIIGNVNQSKEWNHGATSVTSANDGTIKVYAPEDTQVGDTLFLFLSRTDGLLPLSLDQWNRGAACLKSFNNQDSCMRAAHCVKRDGPYCLEFDQKLGGGDGRDLGTVVFYRHVTEDDPGCWTVELPGKTTVWAIVAAISGVNRDRPIFRTHGTSCDVSNCLYLITFSVNILFYSLTCLSIFVSGRMGECVPIRLRVSRKLNLCDLHLEKLLIKSSLLTLYFFSQQGK